MVLDHSLAVGHENLEGVGVSLVQYRRLIMSSFLEVKLWILQVDSEYEYNPFLKNLRITAMKSAFCVLRSIETINFGSSWL